MGRRTCPAFLAWWNEQTEKGIVWHGREPIEKAFAAGIQEGRSRQVRDYLKEAHDKAQERRFTDEPMTGFGQF